MLLFTLLNSPNLLTELSVPIKMHPEQYQIFADMIQEGREVFRVRVPNIASFPWIVHLLLPLRCSQTFV
jgi:hypothetical protein